MIKNLELLKPPAFVPEIEVGGVNSLLDQMDSAFMIDAMQRHAMQASRLLASITDESPSALEQYVADFSRFSHMQNLDQTDSMSMTIAVAAAAIMMVAREGSQTAIEKIEGALKLLSDRYQADW